MGDTGPELAQQPSTLGDSSICAAEINALAGNSGPADTDLAPVVAHWPDLPVHSKRIILGMVRKAAGLVEARATPHTPVQG